MGAYKLANQAFSGIANEDMSSSQYKLAVITSGTNNTVNICSLAGEPVFGAVQNKPNSGQHAEVDFMGITKVIAGGVISAGVPIATNATGFGVVTAGSGTNIVGYAITGCASGEIFTMMIDRCYV